MTFDLESYKPSQLTLDLLTSDSQEVGLSRGKSGQAAVRTQQLAFFLRRGHMQLHAM